MKLAFSFDLPETGKSKKSILKTVFFHGTAQVDEEIVYGSVEAHYATHPASDEVLFIAPTSNQKAMVDVLNGGRVPTRIRLHTSNHNRPKPRLLIVDYKGVFVELTGNQYETQSKVDEHELQRIKQEGAFDIFRHNQGMLEASASHHYVKPSLKHTNRFIRAGSVLVHGVEIEFLAMWLLPLLTNKTRHIYTDSSTINALAFALINLRNEAAARGDRIAPSVHSFESYKGLKNQSFPNKAGLVVLVSASSGGGMIDDLIVNHGIDHSKICTLFYLGIEKVKCGILCDLTVKDSNPGGYEPAKITKSGDRGDFPQNSLAVHILSESFVPENPHVESVMITQDDIPSWWNSFKQSFLGRGAIRCFASDPSETYMAQPPAKAVVITLEAAIASKTKFRSRLDQILLTAIPQSLGTVIHLEDQSSMRIVNMVKTICGSVAKRIRWLGATKVTKNPGLLDHLKEKSKLSTLVIAGVITDGTALLDIAQILRNKQTNHALTFFIGLAACQTEKAFKELKSNLVYSQSGVPYGFNFVQSIELAREFRGDTTAWDDELHFWGQIKRMSKTSNDCLKAIEDRMGQLRSGRLNGAANCIFLPSSPRGIEALKLRGNSVFTEGLSAPLDFSQADVFFAAQTVLHRLRNNILKGRSLAQQAHKRAVLSPTLFYRFSDGVIQAAFLRAATHQELDYRMSPDLSKQMADTLCGIFQHAANPRAEALTEVLYAIASEKLRISKSDLAVFVRTIEKNLRRLKLDSLAKVLFRESKARL